MTFHVNSESSQTLFASPLVRIEVVRCERARRGLSCEECKSEHQIAVPLSGVNVRQVDGKNLTISPAHLTLSNRGEEYRVAHPYGSGETQINIVPRDDLLLELLTASDPRAQDRREHPFRHRQLPIASKARLAVQLLMAAAKSQTRSILELEEAAIALIDSLLAAGDSFGHKKPSAPRDVELAQQARAMLAACYAEPLTLQDIASGLEVSVHHLCRAYRRATGATLWSELQQLRSRAALSYLAEGERDLTAVALALGYSHHSHFTAAFRRELGLTPSTARRLFAEGSLSKVRQLLV